MVRCNPWKEKSLGVTTICAELVPAGNHNRSGNSVAGRSVGRRAAERTAERSKAAARAPVRVMVRCRRPFSAVGGHSRDRRHDGREGLISSVLLPPWPGGGGTDDINPSLPVVSAVATVATTALKSTPPGVFTITRTGASTAALTVQYALSGTATNGAAYNTLPGSVVIPAGTNSAQIVVTPRDFSFQGLQQTVILTVVGSPNYDIALADSGAVTILNNDVSPTATQATTDNGWGGTATTMDVWFASAVTIPSATNLANYTLINAPGLTLTGATLGNHSLRVVLGVSGTIRPRPKSAFTA